MPTHKARWDALMVLLESADRLAKECGSEEDARAKGDVSVEEYGGFEWSDLETRLASIYANLGGDLPDLAHAVTQPWAQEMQEDLRK